jgi:hypothetical protein
MPPAALTSFTASALAVPASAQVPEGAASAAFVATPKTESGRAL